jgi:uncharacterized protein YdcH (DUF465 family)
MYKSIDENIKFKITDMKMSKLQNKDNILKILPYTDTTQKAQNNAGFFKNMGI